MRRLALAAVMLCSYAALAEGQVAHQTPTRRSPGLFGGGRPVDPNRSRNELTLLASVLSGYGDFLTPGGTPGGLGPTAIDSTYSGTADATLRHYYGRSARFLSSELRAFSSVYSHSADPSFGAAANVSTSIDLGRRNTIRAAQSVDYEPNLVLGAFTTLQGDLGTEPLPESGGSSGLRQQRSISSVSSAGVERRWNVRRTTGVNVSYSRMSYLDALGFDSRTLAAMLSHRQNLTRAFGLQTSYRYSESSTIDRSGTDVPITDHSADGGVSYDRRLSPTRRLSFSAGVGATHVNTVHGEDEQRLEYWTPSGYGSIRVDLGRTWALTTAYRRAINVLQGITPESFPTDAATLRLDGRMGRRVDASMSGSFSNGRSGAASGTSRFETYTATTQLRWAVASCCAVSGGYHFYNYQLHGIETTPTGLPSQYSRHSVTVGLSLFVPLYGSFSTPSQR